MDREFFHQAHSHLQPHRILRILGFVFIGITVAALFASLFGFLVMHLWNWLMPAIFGITTITYLQAFGITLLAKILFSGVQPPHPKSAGGLHKNHAHHFHEWACRGKRAADSHDSFSPEEMQHYREFWKEKGSVAFKEYMASVGAAKDRPEKEE